MIPVNEPLIAKNAQKYVLDCIKTGWISSAGQYITKFEEQFAKFIGTKYAVTTTSGTTALQLALASLGIGKNDEVIIPDLTIISCVLAVLYLGAKPVFVDVDSQTGNIDPTKIEAKISKKTRAIMVVHLYGHPANMAPIITLAKKYHLWIIEDAAEAHGAQVKVKSQKSEVKSREKSEWRKVGSIGDIGCFSFYGNKIITSGEGGMLVTNNKKIYEKAKSLKDLAHSKKRRFLHYQIGYNFRMTNLQAALGLAQLEQVDKYIAKKRWMAQEYHKQLKDIPFLELPSEGPWVKNVYWMYALKVKKNSPISKTQLRKRLFDMGVDTRDFFIPMHQQPILKSLGLASGHYPVSTDLSARGFYLPSGLAITQDQIKTVANAIKKI